MDTDKILTVHRDIRFDQIRGVLNPEEHKGSLKILDELECEHIVWEKHGWSELVRERDRLREENANLKHSIHERG